MKKSNKLINILNNNLFNLILAFLVSVSFSKYGIINGKDIISLFIFFILYKFFNSIDLNKIKRKDRKASLILGIIYSLLFVLGRYTCLGLYSRNSIIVEFLSFKGLFYLITFFFFFFFFFIYLIQYFNNAKFKYDINTSDKKLFLISFVLMFGVWSIYFFLFYPGILSFDSIRQFEQFMLPHMFPLNDWQPVFHTSYLALIYKIGFKITKNITLSVGFVSFTQMTIVAIVFSYIILSLKKFKAPRFVIILSILYYSLLPVFGYYSITLWKDIVFGAVTPLIVIKIYGMVYNKEKNKLKDYFILGLLLLLWTLFRNNGIYIVLFMFLFNFIGFKDKIPNFTLVFIVVIGLYFGIKGPIFKRLNIQKTPTAESLSIPLQQVSRMIYLGYELDRDDMKIIDKLIPLEKVRKVYDPYLSDFIKNSISFNNIYLDKNKKELFRVYLRSIKRHPIIAVDAYLASTIGYWYPNNTHWVYFDKIYPNILGIKKKPLIKSKAVSNMIKFISRDDLPILSLYLRVAIYYWIILFFLFLIVRNKGTKYIYPFMPVIGIWLTLMMASPVFGEFRYIFGAVTSLPLVVGLALSKEKEKK